MMNHGYPWISTVRPWRCMVYLGIRGILGFLGFLGFVELSRDLYTIAFRRYFEVVSMLFQRYFHATSTLVRRYYDVVSTLLRRYFVIMTTTEPSIKTYRRDAKMQIWLHPFCPCFQDTPHQPNSPHMLWFFGQTIKKSCLYVYIYIYIY